MLPEDARTMSKDEPQVKVHDASIFDLTSWRRCYINMFPRRSLLALLRASKNSRTMGPAQLDGSAIADEFLRLLVPSGPTAKLTEQSPAVLKPVATNASRNPSSSISGLTSSMAFLGRFAASYLPAICPSAPITSPPREPVAQSMSIASDIPPPSSESSEILPEKTGVCEKNSLRQEPQREPVSGYNHRDGDVMLISSDEIVFKVHGYRLKAAR